MMCIEVILTTLVYNIFMNVKIEIDTRTFVRFWIVVIGFILAGLLIYSARSALLIIGGAFFIAIALNPPVNRIIKLLPSKSRVMSTALAYVAVVGFLAVIAFLVIPPISQQIVKFAQNVPELIDTASDQYSGVDHFVKSYKLQNEYDQVINSIKDSATQFASSAGSILITSISSLINVFFSGILILVLAFLMLIEGPGWFEKIWSIYPDKNKMYHHKKIVSRMYSVVTGYVVGQLSVSTLAGMFSGISVLIISLIFGTSTSLAIPAAAIVFISSLIPLFGGLIGSILVVMLLILNSVPAAVIFLIAYVIYQQIEGNYISPKIQAKKLDLSALAILSSVTIGIYLFGIIGAIISIPVAGCIRVFVEEYQRFASSERKKSNRKNKDTKSLNL